MADASHILLLGAGGFIGAHLTARLLQEGYRITAIDTHADKIAEWLEHPRLTFIERDIRGQDLAAFIREAGVVFDLIAHANPSIYVDRPLEVFQLNFLENLRIAESCAAFGKRLIQFSSCEVYGKTAAAYLREHLTDPEDPALATFLEDHTPLVMGPVAKHRWIYACAKQMLERVLHAYGLEDRLNYTIIRPFNFIGPKIDYLPSQTDGAPRVFSFFMEALLTGTPMKLVDGGGQRRCYTYIDDAMDCTLAILRNPGRVCDRQIFNIGSPGNETTIRDLAHRMRALYREEFALANRPGPAIVSVSGEEFYGVGYDDSDRRIPDIAKARSLLSWEPRWGLTDLLRETIRYYVRAAVPEPPAMSPAAPPDPAAPGGGP